MTRSITSQSGPAALDQPFSVRRSHVVRAREAVDEIGILPVPPVLNSARTLPSGYVRMFAGHLDSPAAAADGASRAILARDLHALIPAWIHLPRTAEIYSFLRLLFGSTWIRTRRPWACSSVSTGCLMDRFRQTSTKSRQCLEDREQKLLDWDLQPDDEPVLFGRRRHGASVVEISSVPMGHPKGISGNPELHGG